MKLAKSLALQQANDSGSEGSVSAGDGEIARKAISEANLWLDTACEFNPAPGETQVLTRAAGSKAPLTLGRSLPRPWPSP